MKLTFFSSFWAPANAEEEDMETLNKDGVRQNDTFNFICLEDLHSSGLRIGTNYAGKEKIENIYVSVHKSGGGRYSFSVYIGLDIVKKIRWIPGEDRISMNWDPTKNIMLLKRLVKGGRLLRKYSFTNATISETYQKGFPLIKLEDGWVKCQQLPEDHRLNVEGLAFIIPIPKR